MTQWGWKERVKGSVNGGVTWVSGTLEESYEKVAGLGGNYILVSAIPVSEYHRVMAETYERVHPEGDDAR